MTPLERLQEARARRVVDVLAAITAIEGAEALSFRAETCRRRDTPWLTAYQNKRRQAAGARYERIRRLASIHPDWTSRQLAKHVGLTTTTVTRALQGSGIRMANSRGGAPLGNQNGCRRAAG